MTFWEETVESQEKNIMAGKKSTDMADHTIHVNPGENHNSITV